MGRQTSIRENGTSITLGERDRQAFERARSAVRNWCREHGLEVGILEVALGASAVALAVHNGVYEMGRDLVGSAMSSFNCDSTVGSAIGGTAGMVAGQLLGSIGVAAGGTAVALPVGILVGGGALLLGAMGYTVGDVIHNCLHPSIDLPQLLGNASLLVVGTALLIDGARRIVKDKRIRTAAARIRDNILQLPAVDVVARSFDDLQAWSRAHPEILALATPTASVGAIVATGAGGVAAGSALAAGSVTVLGSHALGSVALALGLASAPVWPAVLGGFVAAGLGYAVWRGVQRTAKSDQDP
jgi:hypothetical protein